MLYPVRCIEPYSLDGGNALFIELSVVTEIVEMNSDTGTVGALQKVSLLISVLTNLLLKINFVYVVFY